MGPPALERRDAATRLAIIQDTGLVREVVADGKGRPVKEPYHYDGNERGAYLRSRVPSRCSPIAVCGAAARGAARGRGWRSGRMPRVTRAHPGRAAPGASLTCPRAVPVRWHVPVRSRGADDFAGRDTMNAASLVGGMQGGGAAVSKSPPPLSSPRSGGGAVIAHRRRSLPHACWEPAVL